MKTTTLLASLLLLSTSLLAQSYPNSLNEDSVRPEADAEFIKKVRARMDKIRRTQKRPTVALVLSGGGAKGAAEVGAIKYIEELGLPIDLVCGTSIGGLVGGLYSMGYNSADLQELFVSQDWGVTLSDNVSNDYISYPIKEFKSKTIYSLDIGRNQSLSTVATLPSGYIYGFNVNNLFSSLAVGYSGDISFAEDLPIPFSCVAADIVTCKAYNWTGGSISKALRSTMSIPGLFAPVRHEDMTLVDGGVRNNFPADLAKEMGADYIIGISLRADPSEPKSINHIGNILNQFITMLNKEVYDDNLSEADIVISPDLHGYGMLSFNPTAVNSLVDSGYAAAKSKETELLALRAKVGSGYADPRLVRKATDISKKPVKVSSISFEGLDDEDVSLISRMISLDASKELDKAAIDEAMGILQASAYFAEVKYSLRGASEPYDLVFECTLAPVNKLGFGLRGDTEEGVAAYLSYGLNANKLHGSQLDLEAKISHNFKAKAKYSYTTSKFPRINVEASFASYNSKVTIPSARNIYSVNYVSHNEAIYLGDGQWKKFNLRIGLQNYGIKYINSDLLSLLMGDRKQDNLLGAFLDAHYYSFDDAYFPTKGSSIKLKARYDFARIGDMSFFEPMSRVSFQYKSVLALGSKFALIPTLQAVWNYVPRGNFTTEAGEDDEEDFSIAIPMYTLNYIGSSMDARYHRNQIPFFGLNNSCLADDCILTGTLELRYNPLDKLFCSLLGGYVDLAPEIPDFFGQKSRNIYAFGTEVGYKSPVGPVRLNLHWNSSNGFGALLSIGCDF